MSAHGIPMTTLALATSAALHAALAAGCDPRGPAGRGGDGGAAPTDAGTVADSARADADMRSVDVRTPEGGAAPQPDVSTGPLPSEPPDLNGTPSPTDVVLLLPGGDWRLAVTVAPALRGGLSGAVPALAWQPNLTATPTPATPGQTVRASAPTDAAVRVLTEWTPPPDAVLSVGPPPTALAEAAAELGLPLRVVEPADLLDGPDTRWSAAPFVLLAPDDPAAALPASSLAVAHRVPLVLSGGPLDVTATYATRDVVLAGDLPCPASATCVARVPLEALGPLAAARLGATHAVLTPLRDADMPTLGGLAWLAPLYAAMRDAVVLPPVPPVSPGEARDAPDDGACAQSDALCRVLAVDALLEQAWHTHALPGDGALTILAEPVPTAIPWRADDLTVSPLSGAPYPTETDSQVLGTLGGTPTVDPPSLAVGRVFGPGAAAHAVRAAFPERLPSPPRAASFVEIFPAFLATDDADQGSAFHNPGPKLWSEAALAALEDVTLGTWWGDHVELPGATRWSLADRRAPFEDVALLHYWGHGTERDLVTLPLSRWELPELRDSVLLLDACATFRATEVDAPFAAVALLQGALGVVGTFVDGFETGYTAPLLDALLVDGLPTGAALRQVKALAPCVEPMCVDPETAGNKRLLLLGDPTARLRL